MVNAPSKRPFWPLLKLILRRKLSGDLLLFVICQTLAVAIVTGILIFSDRIENAIRLESAGMLAADWVIHSSRPPNASWLKHASETQLQQVESVRLASMLFYKDALEMGDIRAVSAAYPLRGELMVSGNVSGDVSANTPGNVPENTDANDLDIDSSDVNRKVTSKAPPLGEVWLDKNMSQLLGAELGSEIEVGDRSLRFTRFVVELPGSGIPSMGFSGQVLMRIEDLPSTGLVQPGSRLAYQWMLAGNPKTLEDFEDWLQPRLSVHERIERSSEGNERTEQVLQRASGYLGLGSAIAVLLAGIAAVIAATRYMLSQQDSVAIIRALGASRRQILWAYLAQFIFVSGLALLLGYALGFSIQAAGFWLLQSLIVVPNLFSVDALVAGLVTALFCLLCFAVPSLFSIVKISPMRLLRSVEGISPPPIAGLGFALGFVLLMYFYSGDAVSTGIVSLVIIVLALSVWSLVRLLSASLTALVRNQLYRDEGQQSRYWRRVVYLGITAFYRQKNTAAIRVSALAMTIALLVVITGLRGALLQEWQLFLPDKTPNYFVIGLAPDEAKAFEDRIRQPSFDLQPLYPVARARLVAINGLSFGDWGVTNVEALATLDREMMLTEMAKLPDDNKILAGQWHGTGGLLENTQNGTDVLSKSEVSVEGEIAERLHISLGDKLHFSFAGEQVITTVSSIRELNWNTMRPNFYFVLAPPYLTVFPYSYMTSFYAPPGNGEMMANLNREFPSATLMDIGAMVERAQRILARVSLAVEAVAVITVIAGLLVVVASLRATLDTRLQEQTIARALGGSGKLLQQALLVELGVTGLLAGVTGVIAAALILYALGEWVFQLPLVLSVDIAVLIPVAVTLVVTLTGAWVLRRVSRQSPLAIWRQ